MTALADVFVRVRPDTTGLSAEMSRDVEAATSRINARVNVEARVQIEQSILRTELANLRSQLASTGDVTLRPRIRALESDLRGLENSVDDAVSRGATKSRTKFWTAIVAGSVVASPAIAAAITAGLGASGIGAGIALAIQNPGTKNAIQSLGDSLKTELMGAAAPFNAAIMNSIPLVQSAFASVKPELDSVFGSLAPALERLAAGFGGFLQEAMPGIAAASSTAASLFGTLADMLPTLGATISSFFQMIASHSDDIKSGLVFAVNLLIGSVQALTGFMSGLLSVFGPVLQIFGGSAGALQFLTSAILAGIVAWKTYSITVGIVEAVVAVWPAVTAAASLGMAVLTGAEEAAAVAAGELAVATGVATGGISTIIGLLVAAGAGFAIFKSGMGSSGAVAANSANQFHLAVPPLKEVNDLMKQYGINRRDAERFVSTGKTGDDVLNLKLAWLDAKQAMTDHYKANHQAALDAGRDLELANRAVRDANQGVIDAESTLTKDHADAKDAQKALTDARKDAAKELINLRDAARQASDAEESAYDKLAGAKRNLANVDINDPEAVRKAQADLLAAQNDHTSAVDKNKQASDALSVAQRKGIEGSDQVVAAKKRISDIDKRIESDERALAKAHEAVSDAQYNQVKASKAARDARDKDTHSTDINTASGRENLKLQQALQKAYKDLHPTYNVPAGAETDAHRAQRLRDALAPGPDEGKSFWQHVKDGYKTEVFEPVGNFFGTILPGWLNLRTDAAPGWSGFWGDLKTGFMDKLGNPFQEFFGHTLPGWLNFKTDAAPGWKGYWHDLKTGVDDKLFHPVGNWFSDTLPGWFKGVKKSVGTKWSDFWDDTKQDFNRYLSTPISNFFSKTVPGWFSGLGKSIAGVWTTMKTNAVSGLNDVIGVLNGAAGLINGITSKFGVTIPPIPTIPVDKKATGGLIHGPGNETSDDVPIWASKGEFMQRAAAVKYYGVDFMKKLNNLEVPKLATGGSIDEIIGTARKSGIYLGELHTNPDGYHGAPHPRTGGWHDVSQAVDFGGEPGGGGPSNNALAQWFMKNYGKDLLEEIHSSESGPPYKGWYIKNGSVVSPYGPASAHYDHLHVAAKPGFSGGGSGGIGGFIGGLFDDLKSGAGSITRDLLNPIVTPVMNTLNGMGFLGKLGAGVLDGVVNNITGLGASGDSAGGFEADPVGAAQTYAKGRLSAFGWGPEQFGPLKNLWEHESNWRVHATNPSSGAYGIPQSLPGSKMASAGNDWRDSFKTQINWGMGYIKGRNDYGNPAAAWSKWQGRSPHWYDQGGWLTDNDIAINGKGKGPEAVLTPEESINFKKLVGKGADKNIALHIHGDVNAPVDVDTIMNQLEFASRRL